MREVLGDKRTIAVLLAPALIVYTLVMLVPMAWSLGYTLFDGSVISGFQFTGLDNFRRLFDDSRVGDALLFTLKYAVVITVGQIVFGYVLALLYVFVLKKASALVRTLVFFPVVMPTVAVALLFQQLFEIAPRTGPVNALLNAVGLESVNWLGDPGTAFIVLAIMDIWRSMGFYAVLLYAGLIDIPDELFEAASLDGASGWRLVRNVVLPLSFPVLISSLIFSINGTLKVFDSIYALTGGGPGTATTPLTLAMYRTSFANGDYGYGATIASALTVISLLVTLLIFKTSRRDLTQG